MKDVMTKTKTPTYQRKAYEKIWNVLCEIEELKLLYPEGAEYSIPFMPRNYTGSLADFWQQRDEKHAILLNLVSMKAIASLSVLDGFGGKWFIKLGSAYSEIFKRYENEYYKTKSLPAAAANLPRPIFDKQKGAVVFNGKSHEIEIGSVEYYLCLLTFEQFGEKIEELKVIDEAGKTDTKRVVYDAHRRLNEKVQKELGIPLLFGYGSARVWVRAEQFESEKEQEKQPKNVSHM